MCGRGNNVRQPKVNVPRPRVDINKNERIRSLRPRPQRSYANLVIDDETGKAMEYRDLLKDPKYKNTWSMSGYKEYGKLLQ